MRQFKLRNKAGYSSFDFKENKIIITEVSGLGNNFDITVKEGAVVNFQKDLDPITLTANYGVGGNAYKSYNDFARFIEEHLGEVLVLEYTANNRTVLADVMVKSIPKSQKTGYGVITEQIVIIRLTYWYLSEVEVLTSAGLSIPNALSIPLAVNINVSGGSQYGFNLKLEKDIEVISEIKTTESLPGYYIDSENKRVTGIDGKSYYNAFDKRFDTFLMIPQGTYRLTYTGVINGTLSINYKKWVVD